MPTGSSERPQEYVADVSFDDLGLSPELRRAIAERGYTHPTPVQAKAYAPARQGKDLIVRSKTGTGKTAAFGLPLIDQIPMGTREVRALIMCPTRELALQVTHELTALAKYRDVSVTSIYGGASMKQQEDALREGASIIVGTPGRVFDHIRRGNLKLETCRHAVLDEADEMLNQGFYEEVTRILDHLPKEGRQVLLFSATVPEDIQRLIARYTKDPETLLLSGDVYTVEHIQHVRYELSDAYPKPRNLLYMLELEDPENAIIFCNTRTDTELVTAVLNRNGFDAELLNGDLPQKERERVMGRIKRGEVAFMVATDLAARGIDISDLGHVINYSLPEDAAVYLHRVGRTGRIGKKGVALNITSGRELATLTTLEKKYGITFEQRTMPTAEEANRLFTERHVRELKEAGSGSIYEAYLPLASTLKGRPDADELIAYLLKYFFTHRRMERAQLAGIPIEPPVREERREGRGERQGGRGRDREERRGGRDRDERRGGRERPPRDEQRTAPAGTPAVERAEGASAEAAPRRERRDRPPRERSESGSRTSDRELFEQSRAHSSEAPTPAAGTTGTQQVASVAPSRPKLSDRELFERLQRGEPLPPIDDPTASSGGASQVAREARPRRERGEREERGERRRREPREQTPVEAGHARLWLNLGKLDGIDEGGLPAALEALGAPAGKVQKTELRGSYSYIHVADGDVATFEGLMGKLHNGEKALKVERARER
ncbi:MAG: DEAD/DEAH box helicase [Myxococcaceae bacterium]|nr:DEAD/DEAH box helicase [Myxococcaceae bacterium]